MWRSTRSCESWKRHWLDYSKSKWVLYHTDAETRPESHLLNDVWLSPEGLPSNKPSTLISSSSSSQWMPYPFPINRQFWSSDAVAFISRGYQASGTVMERPSLKSTVNASCVTVTCSAAETLSSSIEVTMPAGISLFLCLPDKKSSCWSIPNNYKASNTLIPLSCWAEQLKGMVAPLKCEIKPEALRNYFWYNDYTWGRNLWPQAGTVAEEIFRLLNKVSKGKSGFIGL